MIFRGVAARALHLSRGVEKPSGRVTYIVVLEGLCRISVQELSTRGTYYVARISRLDLTKSGKVLYCDPLFICLLHMFCSSAKFPSYTCSFSWKRLIFFSYVFLWDYIWWNLVPFSRRLNEYSDVELQ